MSISGPDDTPPPSELQGLDPKDLLQAGLDTVPPITLPPQPADPDATLRVAGPSQPSAPQVELPLPEELTHLLPGGNYHVESFLGQGGMGAVYKGMQVRLKRPVAIKIMRRDMGKDYDFEARFEREAQAMAKLNHPNIVSVIDFGEAGADYLYIVMELIDGADLMDVIRGGQMTQEMALSLLPQVCDALQFAHDHGIVHRDIKPSNIMLTRDGRVKMCDFGLAKRYDVESSFHTQTGTGMGTPDYAAPEQFEPKANIDHRADIYALGVMIYQMITGQLPRGVWKPPSQRADIAPAWDDIVSRAMQSDPSDRYQHASEVKTDVSSIPLAAKSDASTPARKESADAGKSARITPKSSAQLVIGLIAVAVIVAGAFFALRAPTPKSGGLQPPSQAATTPGFAPQTPTPAVQNTPLLAQPLPASGWKPLFSDTEWRKNEGTQREFKDGVVHLRGAGWRKPQPSPDGAIRAKVQYHGQSRPCLEVRNSSDGGRYKLDTQPDGKTFLLLYFAPGDEKSDATLGTHVLPNAIEPGQTLQMELRVQGSLLTAFINGNNVIEVQDTRITKAGEWGIYSQEAWFESVEVQPFPAAARPAPIAAPALPESGWKPLFTEREWKAKPGFKNGQLNVSHARATKPQTWSDGAIRARIEYRDGTKSPSLVARQTGGGGGFYYRLGVGSDGKHIYLSHLTLKPDDNFDMLGRYFLSAPLKPNDKLLLELRVQGDRLTGLLDGKVVVEAQDTHLQAPGEWGIIADEGWFESVEVQPHPAEVAGIKLWDTPEKLPKKKGLSWENGALRLDATTISYSNTTSRDVAFRATALVGSDSAGGVSLFIHHIPQKGNYALSLNGNAAEIRIAASGQPTRVLAKWPLTRSYRPDEWVRLEIRAEGARLTALVDGQILGSVEDRTLTETDRAQGGVSIAVVRTSYFKDIEYVPLDAPAVSPSPNLPVSWQNALADTAQLSLSGGAQVTKDGLLLTGKSSQALVYAGQHRGDGAIRMRANADGLRQGLRVRSFEKGNHYNLDLPNQTTLKLQRWDNVAKQSTVLREFPLPQGFNLNAEHEIELRAEGSTFTVSLDRQILGSATDAAYPTGSFGVSVGDPITKPVLIKALEVLDSGNDAVSSSPSLPVSSSPSSATKDAPFINTLGMKFVPVPGTKVLFCMHETRYQDYQTYAAETKVAGDAWKDQTADGFTPTTNKAEHPVMNVSWQEARGFCDWLSKKEGVTYRLPTDEEWSLAVGLAPDNQPTSIMPAMLSGRDKSSFPWGGDFPPKTADKAGNYGDASKKAKAPRSDTQYLEDYDDGFPTTAPVMSFKPNALGLFDLGGNVWEWCEDWIDDAHQDRVLRGGSWLYSDRAHLLSSHRGRRAYNDRSYNDGFRVVLVPSTPIAP